MLVALYQVTVKNEAETTVTWEYHQRHEDAYEVTKNRIKTPSAIHVRLASGLEEKIVKSGHTPTGNNEEMLRFAQEKGLIG